MGSLIEQERSLEFLKGVFCGFYTMIDKYLRDEMSNYKEARRVIDRFKDIKSIIFTSKKQYDEDESFITKLVTKNVEACDEMFNLYSKKENNKYDKSKIERYRDVILSKPDDLEKLLKEDAVSKYTKKYFEIWDEDDNGLSIEDYLFYNSFPKDQKDISDEQVIIKNTIERIVSNLKYYLKDFYFQISLYCILQYEPEYRELLNRITSIQILEGKINDIVSTYFDKDSSLHSYIDINQINEDIFNEQINSLIEDPNINLVGEHLYKLKRYKKYIEDIIKNDSDISIFELLFNDAYTGNAKKYFNKED